MCGKQQRGLLRQFENEAARDTGGKAVSQAMRNQSAVATASGLADSACWLERMAPNVNRKTNA